MNFDEIEELIRKYLSTGIAVVVIVIAPGTDADRALPSRPGVITVEPGAESAREEQGTDPEPSGRRTEETTAERSTAEEKTAEENTPSEEAADEAAAEDGTADQAPVKESGKEAGEEATARDSTADRTGAAGTDPEKEPNPSAGDEDDPADSTASDSNAADSGAADSETAEPGAADSGAGTTAAERHGWGEPNREDDFSGGTEQWDIYDGPGHAGQGTRSPSAVSLADGIMTITGDSSGTTAGMAWNPGQKYGRWEGRVRAPASDESYNALMLLWPDAEDFPVGGEIDFMEMMDASRQKTDIFIHYGADNSQVNGSVEIDATQWHNWAVEWTPEAITAYVDGEEWYRTTDQSIFPPGPMHLCIQLDWFPQGGTPKESTMQVDWVRQYSLDGGAARAGGIATDSGAAKDSSAAKGSSAATDSSAANDSSAATDRATESAQSADRDQEADSHPIREFFRRMFSWR